MCNAYKGKKTEKIISLIYQGLIKNKGTANMLKYPFVARAITDNMPSLRRHMNINVRELLSLKCINNR